jgi:Mg/Co/Ni transporter MgtE
MLPFILRRLGFDPATSSAPFVATLVDVTRQLSDNLVAIHMHNVPYRQISGNWEARE